MSHISLSQSAVKLLRDGHPVTDVARQIGLSNATVSILRARLGLTVRSKRIGVSKGPVATKILSLLGRNLSDAQLAREANCSPDWAGTIRRRAGVVHHHLCTTEHREHANPVSGEVCGGCHYWCKGDCDSDLAARMRGVELLNTRGDDGCEVWRVA